MTETKLNEKQNPLTYEDYVAERWYPPGPSLRPTEDEAQLMYSAMCMAGEAGETCDAVKKFFKGKLTKQDIVLEVGDTLYYLTNLAGILGYSMDDVKQLNREKLDDRFGNKI